MIINLECKPDERLVMCLGIRRKEIRHHNDKGQVCNALKKSEEQRGLIDEDPGSAQPTYLRGLNIVSDELGIRELEDRNGNAIIILKPKLEDWLIAACEESQIDLSDYSLPNSSNHLHKEINYKLNRLEEVIEALLAKKSRRLNRLRSLLNK